VGTPAVPGGADAGFGLNWLMRTSILVASGLAAVCKGINITLNTFLISM